MQGAATRSAGSIERFDHCSGCALVEQLEPRTLMAVDLSVDRLEMEPGSVSDASIATSVEVTNRGESDGGPFTLTLGLTLDRVIGNSDDVTISVESVPGLAAGFSISAASTHDTPVDVPPGNYFGFLIVRLDDNSTDADPINDSAITAARVFRSGGASGEISIRGAGLLIPSGDTTPRPADHTHFGHFKAVTPYRDRAFVVTNTGEGALDIGTVTIDGPGSASFSIKKRPDSILLRGASSRLVLRFDPTSAGIHNATVSLASSAASDPSYEFAIRGRGIRPGLVRLAFGDRVIAIEGETVGASVRLSSWVGDGDPTFVISNTGPRKVYLAGAHITPYGVPPFFQTDPHFTIHENPTGYLRRGASVSFQITADGPSEVGIMNLHVYLAGFWSTQISFLIDD